MTQVTTISPFQYKTEKMPEKASERVFLNFPLTGCILWNLSAIDCLTITAVSRHFRDLVYPDLAIRSKERDINQNFTRLTDYIKLRKKEGLQTIDGTELILKDPYLMNKSLNFRMLRSNFEQGNFDIAKGLIHIDEKGIDSIKTFFNDNFVNKIVDLSNSIAEFERSEQRRSYHPFSNRLNFLNSYVEDEFILRIAKLGYIDQAVKIFEDKGFINHLALMYLDFASFYDQKDEFDKANIMRRRREEALFSEGCECIERKKYDLVAEKIAEIKESQSKRLHDDAWWMKK